jgi:hypothetical protein
LAANIFGWWVTLAVGRYRLGRTLARYGFSALGVLGALTALSVFPLPLPSEWAWGLLVSASGSLVAAWMLRDR